MPLALVIKRFYIPVTVPFVAYLHSRLGGLSRQYSDDHGKSTDERDERGLLSSGDDVTDASSTKPTSNLCEHWAWEAER